jgi:hypothetical protein
MSDRIDVKLYVPASAATTFKSSTMDCAADSIAEPAGATVTTGMNMTAAVEDAHSVAEVDGVPELEDLRVQDDARCVGGDEDGPWRDPAAPVSATVQMAAGMSATVE